MSKYTAVSFEGDDHDRKKLAVIASLKGISIGSLVRQAIDQTYADEMKAVEAYFFATDGTYKFHNGTENNDSQ